MRNILKGLLNPEEYRFPDASELMPELELPAEEEAGEAGGEEADSPPFEEEEPGPAADGPPDPEGEEKAAHAPDSGGPVQYAQLQAELILKQAREEAEQLLAR